MLLAGGTLSSSALPSEIPAPEVVGDASSGLATVAPNHAVQASFTARSYAPGSVATLRLRGSVSGLRIQLYRAGAGPQGPLQGAPVGPAVRLGGSAHNIPVSLGSMGERPLLRAGDDAGPGRLARAVRPAAAASGRASRARRPADEHVAGVQLRDDNQTVGDSWYEGASDDDRSFAPLHGWGRSAAFSAYDLPFQRWMARTCRWTFSLTPKSTRRAVQLASSYDLIVFPAMTSM